MEDILAFVNSHYILNLLASVLFVITRQVLPICTALYQLDDEGECHLDWRDTEILMFLCFVILLKNRRWKPLSAKEYISNMFLFTKAANILLFFRQDIRWGIFYALFILVLFLVFPEPAYIGPDSITFFRGQALDEELYHHPNKIWLVEFYAGWSPNCTRFSNTFAELSLKYDNDLFKFGKLDVTRYPMIAKKYKVDSSVTSKNLPTLVLFENGKEAIRKPVVDSKGSVSSYIFKEENVIRDFNLNELYKTTKGRMKNKNKKEN